MVDSLEAVVYSAHGHMHMTRPQRGLIRVSSSFVVRNHNGRSTLLARLLSDNLACSLMQTHRINAFHPDRKSVV